MTASEATGPTRSEQLRRTLSKEASNPFISFLPWIAFWVIGGAFQQWELSCLVALGLAVVVLLLDLLPRGAASADGPHSGFLARLRTVKMLNVATLLFFILYSLFQPLMTPSGLIPVEIYSGVTADGTLAVLVIVSILIGHSFTEQYARESTPEEVWHTPAFHHVNRVLSWAWAIAFGVSAALALVVALNDPTGTTHDVLVWYIPIALIVAALAITRFYPARVHARAEASRLVGVPEGT